MSCRCPCHTNPGIKHAVACCGELFTPTGPANRRLMARSSASRPVDPNGERLSAGKMACTWGSSVGVMGPPCSEKAQHLFVAADNVEHRLCSDHCRRALEILLP